MRGNITKRGPNTWRLRYDVPYLPGQKRHQVSVTVHGTKKEAEDILNRRLTERRGPSSRITVSEYLERWLDSCQVSPRTLYGYAEKVRNYIVPYLGDKPLSDLKGMDCDAMYVAMRQKGLSNTTIGGTHRILNIAMKRALKWELIYRNPADNATPPKPDRGEVKVWDENDFRRFWEVAVESEYYQMYRLAYLTGMRRSELCGLKWENVDLDAGAIRVVQTLQKVPGKGIVVGQPKSKRSRRAIEIGDATVELLLDITARGDYVFTRNGKPVSPDTVSHDFSRLVKEAGLPHLTFHGLRHCHASVLLSKNIHPKVVQERLGHADITMTMNVYSHIMPGMQGKAVSSIESTL